MTATYDCSLGCAVDNPKDVVYKEHVSDAP